MAHVPHVPLDGNVTDKMKQNVVPEHTVKEGLLHVLIVPAAKGLLTLAPSKFL